MVGQETRQTSTKLPVYLAYILCAFIWGTGWFAIRICIGDGGYPILGGAALRYTLASLAILSLAPFFPKAFGRLNRFQTAWLLLAGLCNGTGIALLYWGEKHVSGGLAAVLVATSPIIVAALATMTKSERITRGAIAGALLALAGIGIIFSERLSVSPSHIPSMLSVLGASLGFALSNFIMKTKTGDVKPLQSSALFFITMSIMFWLASPYEAPAIVWPPPAMPTCALIYLALGCSAFTLPVFFYLLKNSSLMFASSLAFIHPIIALITDSLFEHHFFLTLSAYTGVTIVMFGVVLTAMSNEKIRAQKQGPWTIPRSEVVKVSLQE